MFLKTCFFVVSLNKTANFQWLDKYIGGNCVTEDNKINNSMNEQVGTSTSNALIFFLK